MPSKTVEPKDGVIRLSISIDPSLRRNMRIAAAHADMTVGEWSTYVLNLAANKAVGKGGK